MDIAGTLDGSVALGAGVVTPLVPNSLPIEPVQLAISLRARLMVRIPAPVTPGPQLRVVPSISISNPEPVVRAGVPTSPAYLATIPSYSSAQQGIGHVSVVADPDPVWTSGAWVTPPPDAPAGANFLRWTARDLPNPSSFPGSQYLLGTPNAADGTTGLPAGAQQWSASAGSSDAIAWGAIWPFKPYVRPYVHYGADGSVLTIPAAVRFNEQYVQHMFIDMGTSLPTMPFTWVVVGVITDYPTPNYGHYVLDAGETPQLWVSDAQRAAILANGMADDILMTEDFGYRTGLVVYQTQLWGFNDQTPTTRIAKAGYVGTLKPKMFFGVYNGANSSFGSYYQGGLNTATIALADNGTQRVVALGRANGILSSALASNMAVFEIRFWDKALTEDQLAAQFAQLSSTWQFSQFT